MTAPNQRGEFLRVPYSALSHLDCPRCGARHDADQVQGTCSCGSPLLARYVDTPITVRRLSYFKRKAFKVSNQLHVFLLPCGLPFSV